MIFLVFRLFVVFCLFCLILFGVACAIKSDAIHFLRLLFSTLTLECASLRVCMWRVAIVASVVDCWCMQSKEKPVLESLQSLTLSFSTLFCSVSLSHWCCCSYFTLPCAMPMHRKLVCRFAKITIIIIIIILLKHNERRAEAKNTHQFSILPITDPFLFRRCLLRFISLSFRTNACGHLIYIGCRWWQSARMTTVLSPSPFHIRRCRRSKM